jgi:recombination protein RecT
MNGDMKVETPLVNAPYAAAIEAVQDRFKALAGDAGLDWQAEALFALHICQKNPFLAKIATANPLSLQMALLNVAAVGLSLNPAMALAFLIPRKGEIVMDVSYRGLIKIATDTGSILWAKAELVFEADRFEYRGPATPPLHRCDPFAENRGEMRGGYCIAKTGDGEFLVEVMSAADIFQVRDMSEAYKAYLKDRRECPWVTWPGEQSKKVLIKRASKTWPKTPRRLAETIQYLNEKLGEGFVETPALEGDQAVDGASGKGQRPPAPASTAPAQLVDESRIAAGMKVLVTKTIERATASGAWEAAREYLATKMGGPELVWARQELTKAEEASKGQSAAA